jgi:hypothetical protein
MGHMRVVNPSVGAPCRGPLFGTTGGGGARLPFPCLSYAMHTLGAPMRVTAPSRVALRGQRVRSASRPVIAMRRLNARADAEPAKPAAPAVLTSAVPLPAVSAHVTCGTTRKPKRAARVG